MTKCRRLRSFSDVPDRIWALQTTASDPTSVVDVNGFGIERSWRLLAGSALFLQDIYNRVHEIWVCRSHRPTPNSRFYQVYPREEQA